MTSGDNPTAADAGVATIAAGPFSAWLTQMEVALRGDGDADVPCGECTACCTSSQFVHISADEFDTIAHIPTSLLFPAPLMPSGHVLLGYDERGWCPMLTDDGCSIYEHRPRTCRTYDCRIFEAAGIRVHDKPQIDTRARRWSFSHPTVEDQILHDAVRTAAAHQSGASQPAPTQTAVVAIRIHKQFLG